MIKLNGKIMGMVWEMWSRAHTWPPLAGGTTIKHHLLLCYFSCDCWQVSHNNLSLPQLPLQYIQLWYDWWIIVHATPRSWVQILERTLNIKHTVKVPLIKMCSKAKVATVHKHHSYHWLWWVSESVLSFPNISFQSIVTGKSFIFSGVGADILGVEALPTA